MITALVVQLVAILSAEYKLPSTTSKVLTSAILQILTLFPEAKVEAFLIEFIPRMGKVTWHIAQELAHWFANRPPGPPGNPEMGGNQQAENPPVTLDQGPGNTDPVP
jgi:hypothetical protein